MRSKLVGVGGVLAIMFSAGGLPACGGATDTAAGGAPDGGALAPWSDESSFSCPSPLPSLVEDLRPAVPVDYVELRSEQFDSSHSPAREAAASDGGEPPPLLPATTVASSGTACASAKDRGACLQALAQARSGKGGWPRDHDVQSRPAIYAELYVVYTRGDEIGIANDRASLAAFLGAVDTATEARLLVTTQTEDITCTTTPFKSGLRQNDDGSWELLVTGTDCGGDAYQARMSVSADGVITKLDERTSSSVRKICGG